MPKNVIAFIRGQYREKGIGRWAVVRKADNVFVGWAGLKIEEADIHGHGPYLDLGFRITRRYWGQGYATEAAKAWVTYATGTMRADTVCALVEAANTASIRVLEKVGMKQTDAFILDGKPHLWFELQVRQ